MEKNYADNISSDIATTLRSLESRGIKGFYAKDHEAATRKVLDLIPQDAIVGTADSTTARQIGVYDALKRRGTKVLIGYEEGVSKELHEDLVRQSTLCDVFLAGTNALTLDGKIVNLDAVGNRVSGMFYGHPISVVVVGKNKLVDNLEKALDRVRNVIAPNHVHIRRFILNRGRSRAACYSTAICRDCRSEDRICNIFTIIEGKPRRTQINVVIVNEDLGLGWDPSWPRERIERIIEEYKKYTWSASWGTPSEAKRCKREV
jgi:hypothetical protein